MTGIGEQLRAAREARSLSLDEVERQTRIRARLLAALEAEDFSAFASPAQARGFLRNYAAFLGLDVEALLAGSAPASTTGSRRPKSWPAPNGRSAPRPAPPSGAPSGTPPKGNGWREVRREMRRIFTRDLFIGTIFTGLFGLLLAWGALQLWIGMAASATADITLRLTEARRSASAATAGTAVVSTPTPPPPETTPTAPLPTPLPNYVGVNVLVRAEQRAWLRVVVDGAETFVGQMAPGQAREFVGSSVVEVWTGNGQGTRVVFNGQDQGTLGGLGEVVIRLWTLDGPVTPTPTPTP
jgi:cytoskeletal protein RodZ